MGRKRKSITEKSPFKLRKRKLADGREHLVLDRAVGGTHKFEFLKLYLLPGDTQKILRENARTLRQAEDILRQRTEELINERAAEMPQHNTTDMLLVDWFDKFAEQHLRGGGRDVRSVVNTRKIIEHYRPDVLLSQVDRQFCIDFTDWMRNTYIRKRGGGHLAPRTIAGHGETLRMVLNGARREGLIASNPWEKLALSEKPLRPESKREFLTIDEVKKMAEAECGSPIVKRAYMFSCFTGLRISDIRAMKWGDITVSEGSRYVSVIMEKTQNPVLIPLSRQALKWMPEKADSAIPDDCVFIGMSNACNVNSCIKYWAKRAGITKSLSFHTARHTFATMMLTLGVDLYTVSKLLGHRGVRQTQIYAKIIDQRKDDAVNLVDKAF